MKDIVIIDPTCPQWKGNLHMHTNRSSDCNTDYIEAINEYKSKGYNFILVSDHEIYWASEQADSEGFCTLYGAESAFNRHPKRPYELAEEAKSLHLNIIQDESAAAEIPCFEHDQILSRPVDFGLDSWNACIDRYKKMGHIVMLNHPNWSRLSPELMLGIHGCFAFEIFNGGSIWEVGCYTDDAIWDYCLRRGKRIYAAAGDDTHKYADEGECCGSSFNMVSVPKLNRCAIVDGLKLGNFYPSTGPLIYEMRIENGTLYIRFSPVRSIRIIGAPGHGVGKLMPKNKTIEEYSWKIDNNLQYFRVVITAPDDGKAWTQPVFLEDILQEPRYNNVR